MPALHEKSNRSTVPQIWEHLTATSRQQLKRFLPKQYGPSPDEIDRIAVRVMGRLAGQLRRLRIVVRHDGLVLHGHVRSYYAKQLVQEAVMSATDVRIAENAIEIV